MQLFTIKDIENLSGIKAHTLRIWEQRYNMFVPKRKESSHRVYDNEDVKELLQIAFLYHNGWKISKIAALPGHEREQIVRDAPMNTNNFSTYILKLIDAVLDFDEQQFRLLIDEVIEAVGFDKCIIEVCYPYMKKIGMLWVTNNVIPAQEHFSSYIIQNKIIAETEKLKRTDYAERELILFSPQNEFHELPLLFINYLLIKNGWNIIYLGSDISLPILQQLNKTNPAKGLYMHLLTNFTGYDADEYFHILCHTFPDKQIIASGSVVHLVKRSFTNLLLLRSDKEIHNFIERKN